MNLLPVISILNNLYTYGVLKRRAMPNLVNALKIAASIEDGTPMTRRQWVASALVDQAVTDTQALIVANIQNIEFHIEKHLMEMRLLYNRKSFAAEKAKELGLWSSVYFRCWDYHVDVNTAVIELIDKHLLTEKSFKEIEEFLFAS